MTDDVRTEPVTDEGLLSELPDPELIAHLRDTIADLERKVAETHQRHVDEIAFISDRLAEEADEHELCTVYDQVIASINDSDKVTVPLGQREVDVSVRITGSVSFHFDRRVTLAVPVGSVANSPLMRERALDLIISLGVRAMGNSAEEGTAAYVVESTTF
jgi:hypothetical protein